MIEDIVRQLITAKGKRIAVDLDGTLNQMPNVPDYMNMTPKEIEPILMSAKPNPRVIALVNALAKDNLVYIYTARNDVFQEVTAAWLKMHGVEYEFFTVNKPFYDFFLEDKAVRPEELINVIYYPEPSLKFERGEGI